ncbi:MAG: flagellar hook-length control protein [Myxococcales bacterium]|nr:flagellar hook-length control protein [Myxococcales bacterium]HRC56311.1 hypothetical protein [Kofleriaceae bacterium]
MSVLSRALQLAALGAALAVGVTACATEESGAAPVAEAQVDQALVVRYGMTWLQKTRIVDVQGVGSDATTDAYDGDTPCNVSLPLLCIRKSGLAQPGYITSTSTNRWTGGFLAMSRGHLGTDLTSSAAGDAICAGELGAGWEFAEFHDGGGGWNFQGYGSAALAPNRFWVEISNQPANCWNSAYR